MKYRSSYTNLLYILILIYTSNSLPYLCLDICLKETLNNVEQVSFTVNFISKMFQQVACLSVDAQVGHMYVATRV